MASCVVYMRGKFEANVRANEDSARYTSISRCELVRTVRL